jgi:hypothetical protein
VIETSPDLQAWTPTATNGVPSSFEVLVSGTGTGAFYRAVHR